MSSLPESVEFTACAEVDCGEIAEVIDRVIFDSTDGPLAHIRTLCVNRHVLFMPEDL